MIVVEGDSPEQAVESVTAPVKKLFGLHHGRSELVDRQSQWFLPALA